MPRAAPSSISGARVRRQRLAYQAVDDRPEPAFRPCRSLGAPAQFVFAAGQQIACVRRACSAVACARRCSVPAPPCRGLPATA